MMKQLLLTLLLLTTTFVLYAQHFVVGHVVDSLNRPIVGATVYTNDMGTGTSTSTDGGFRLKLSNIPDSIVVKVSCVGYTSETLVLMPSILKSGLPLSITLGQVSHGIDEVYIKANQRRVGNIEKLNVTDIEYLPNISGNFESILKSMPGVSSSNELSSQYSVRGGNFDENLVYVNGIEIFRPFLVRSGQQEGLSFINPDMVDAVKFSAGAFDAEYGDKMSSVLDVEYRKPTKFATNVSVGLLGASASTEGIALDNKFIYIMGLRYKTSRYMLNTLDSKGDYTPSFVDWQGLFTYNISNVLTCSLLGNYSSNRYQFAPDVRETRFGSFNNTLQLKIFYEGQEVDKFQSGMGAVIFCYRPTSSLTMNLFSANYLTHEQETFDLLGQYYLNELDNQLGSTTYTDSLINVGIGGFLNHARNYLDARIHTIATNGSYQMLDNRLKWGATLQREYINDEIGEWDLIDSSGYALPYSNSTIGLSNVLRAKNSLNINRVSGFVQLDSHFDMGTLRMSTSAGVRLSWWDYTNEFLFSPRASITVIPENCRDLHVHFSAGIYYQSPFYKELRLPNGRLNTLIKSQKSAQVLVGLNYYFSAWERPFRLSLEAYHKWLDNLIPYKVDNVRIEYAGENLAKGYAKGIDLKFNGEMVQGVESWVGLSLMKTEEDIKNDSYIDGDGTVVYPGYYRRPTDQRFTFSLFFQDYLPGNDKFKVHLTGYYGSGLPCANYGTNRYDEVFQMPAYRRVDIGFTASLIDIAAGKSLVKRHLGWLRSANLGVEVFNLFNFNNTISYLWVRTVGNQSNEAGIYAVPNYLTSRRVNVKLNVSF